MSKPSQDLVIAAHQRVTKEWWDARRGRFDLFVSELVMEEARAGDAEAAKRRLPELSAIRVLAVTENAVRLARNLIEEGAVPNKAEADALHIATATIHQIDYPLTWNCRHLANAEMQHGMRSVCQLHGYALPVICTPEELMGD